MLKIPSGTTSKIEHVFIQSTAATDGSGLTGLTNASSGLSWYYLREGASSAVSISPVSQTLGTWTSAGFKEVDATNMPGVYEIGIPDAVLAAGASSVSMMLRGVTNMMDTPIKIDLNVDANLVSSDLSASEVSDGIDGTTFTKRRGDRWSVAITGLGDLTGNTNIWFTAKLAGDHDDEDSMLQVDTDTGLLYINGETGTAGNASITVDDVSAGDITLVVEGVETAKLPIFSGNYDVQWLNASGEAATATEGVFNVSIDQTRATS